MANPENSNRGAKPRTANNPALTQVTPSTFSGGSS